MNARHIALGTVALLGTYLAYQLVTHYFHYFRYRLTVEIEVDGKLHSGSSVIEVRYWWTTFSSGGKGWAASVDAGIGPIVDLGPYGHVIAAMHESYDPDLQRRREKIKPAQYSAAELASLAQRAFKTNIPEIAHIRGTATVDTGLPSFIWVPPNHDWRQAKQLLKEEFESSIGSGVHLVRIAIALPVKEKPMKIPKPPPAFLPNLCAFEQERSKLISVPSGAVLLDAFLVGQEYEYWPSRFISICDIYRKGL